MARSSLSALNPGSSWPLSSYPAIYERILSLQTPFWEYSLLKFCKICSRIWALEILQKNWHMMLHRWSWTAASAIALGITLLLVALPVEVSQSKLEDPHIYFEKEVLESHDSDLIMCETDQEGEGKPDQEHFVLIHGLGHGAWCWYKIVTLLKQKGHRVVALDLTSNGINKAAPTDEVSSVAQYSEPLLQYLHSLGNDEKVTLVGHSLAGCPLAYAMEMYPNKVSKAIYLAAFTPRNNQSFLSSAFPTVFPRLVASGLVKLNYRKGDSEMPTSASIVLHHAKYHLYNESPEEDVNLAVSLLTPTPYPMSLEVMNLSNENYGSVRKFYIMLMKDNLFLPEHQQYSVDQNPPERVFKMHASDHSPFFSQPEQLCNLLIHIATL